MSDQEVPEPDAAEQSLLVAGTAMASPPSDDVEAPEADALEQAIEAPLDEDDELR